MKLCYIFVVARNITGKSCSRSNAGQTLSPSPSWKKYAIQVDKWISWRTEEDSSIPSELVFISCITQESDLLVLMSPTGLRNNAKRILLLWKTVSSLPSATQLNVTEGERCVGVEILSFSHLCCEKNLCCISPASLARGDQLKIMSRLAGFVGRT